jgi:hypothetical protein
VAAARIRELRGLILVNPGKNKTQKSPSVAAGPSWQRLDSSESWSRFSRQEKALSLDWPEKSETAQNGWKQAVIGFQRRAEVGCERNLACDRRFGYGGFVGTITVSGLTQREDHCLVVEAIVESLGRDISDISLSQGELSA